MSIFSDLRDVIPFIRVIAEVYNQVKDEKSDSDPESPGEFTKAEAAELGALIVERAQDQELVPDEFQAIADEVINFLRAYAQDHGEAID